MSYPRTPTTTTSAATTTPNETPNELYDVSPATLTVWATPSASTPSKPHNSPNPASLTAIFDAVCQAPSGAAVERGKWGRARPSACRFLLDAVRSWTSLAWSRRVRDLGLLPRARDADSFV